MKRDEGEERKANGKRERIGDEDTKRGNESERGEQRGRK